MNRPRSRLLALCMCSFVAVALTVSCNSVPLEEEHMQECGCGTAEADTLGCAGICMLDGPGACENPLCTCEGDPDRSSDDAAGG